MNEQQALKINGTGPSAATPAAPQQGYRSGIFAKARRDGSGWGLVLVDLHEPARTVPLADGVVIGRASRDAKAEGPGISPEHVRVMVRSDGCYFEDLGSADGTFVDGVRARRIGVMHGDVVRLGQQLAIFVEHDLALYAGAATTTGTLVHGPKQQAEWIDPVFDLVKAGSCVCIEGPPGVGKRTLARLAAAVREAAGETVVIDARAEPKPVIPAGVRPMTWVVLEVDRLPRPQQLEIAHAVGRSTGVSVIATVSQPLDRATGDGHVAPWFATLFSGKRITVPPLEARREDVLPIVGAVATRKGISHSRLSAPFLEALLRAGWPGGVPQLESLLVAAAEADEGYLQVSSVAAGLSRAMRPRPSLPPATDPALARARLEDALARANGSVASAARSLGMSRQAIYREADRLGLDIARRKRSLGSS